MSNQTSTESHAEVDGSPDQNCHHLLGEHYCARIMMMTLPATLGSRYPSHAHQPPARFTQTLSATFVTDNIANKYNQYTLKSVTIPNLHSYISSFSSIISQIYSS